MTPNSSESSWGCAVSFERGAILVLVLAAAALAGCAQPAGPVFEPQTTALRWPAPPEPARVEYVGQIATKGDLKAGRDLGAAIGEAIFGEDAQQQGTLRFDDQEISFVNTGTEIQLTIVNFSTGESTEIVVPTLVTP